MSKQNEIIPLTGLMGNSGFYKLNESHLTPKKPHGLSPELRTTNPRYARIRENAAEFGRAGSAGRVLRNSISTLLKNISDGRMLARLSKEMMKVIKADTSSDSGFRNVIDGETESLKGFEFNANSPLSTTLSAPYSATIDRGNGELVVDMAAFIPADHIAAPVGTTQFKILSAGMEIDFETQKFITDIKKTDAIPWNNKPTAAIRLVSKVPAKSIHPLFLVLGIEFYHSVNGKLHPLMSGGFNSLCLVEVNGA